MRRKIRSRRKTLWLMGIDLLTQKTDCNLLEDSVEKTSVFRKDVYLCTHNQEKKRHVF